MCGECVTMCDYMEVCVKTTFYDQTYYQMDYEYIKPFMSLLELFILGTSIVTESVYVVFDFCSRMDVASVMPCLLC